MAIAPMGITMFVVAVGGSNLYVILTSENTPRAAVSVKSSHACQRTERSFDSILQRPLHAAAGYCPGGASTGKAPGKYNVATCVKRGFAGKRDVACRSDVVDGSTYGACGGLCVPGANCAPGTHILAKTVSYRERMRIRPGLAFFGCRTLNKPYG